jgi:hypothetical protein
VNPVYVGSGAVYTDINDAEHIVSARRTPAGTYTVEVEDDGQYVFFNVPASITIHGAVMSGFEFPLDEAESVTIEGVAYKSYRSSNTYDAGTETIILS